MKIKLPLYFKFILGYLAFGLLGFATISTFSSSIMYGHQLESYSETIYDEANLIASSYSSVYRLGSLVNWLNKLAVSIKKGAPGGWPTSNL